MAGESGQSAGQKILIIDDDITSLDIISFLFEEKGYRVERCIDGFAAIEHAERMEPDLIIVDLMMPKINGADTVRALREKGIGAVPIIAFTAVDEAELHQEARDAGCNEVLTKPCRPEKLVGHVVRHLQRS